MTALPVLRHLRHGAEAILVFAAWGLLAALPVVAASNVMGAIARRLGPHLKQSRVARQNLHIAFPDKTDAQIEAIVVEVWDNLGRAVGEFPHLRQIAAERLEIVGAEHIVHLGADGVPGILIGAHFGGWELSGPLAHRLGVPVHVAYRAANNPLVEYLFRKARGGTAAGFVPKGTRGAKAALTVLKAGGHIGMLVDQKMNDGIVVPFLGRDAMTAPAVATLALKYRCPIVSGRIERLPGVRFRAVIEPPLPMPDSGDVHQDVRTLMADINALIGGWVAAQPGQWLWLHRRWPK